MFNCPIPYEMGLEAEVIPNEEDIITSVRKVEKMGRKRRFGIVSLLGLMLCAISCWLFDSAALAIGPESSNTTSPWWEEQKVRFFWGHWQNFEEAGISREEVMKNLSQVGGSVFVEFYTWGTFNVDNARLAHKYGIRYFGGLMVNNSRDPAQKMRARLAVNKHGLTSVEEAEKGMHFSPPPYVPCLLDEGVIEEWFLKPALEAAKSGLVDGMLIDWEHYGATSYDSMGDYQCYDDDCFSQFMNARQDTRQVPRAERYKWMKELNLLKDYLLYQRDRLREIYSRVAEQVHWDHQGYPSNLREGWYWLRYKCPALHDGKRVFLNFGAIDESAWLYIDGNLRAWYDTAQPSKTWDQPVLLEVTGNLKSGQEHLLVVRVKNIARAGGIWKPIRLMVEQ